MNLGFMANKVTFFTSCALGLTPVVRVHVTSIPLTVDPFFAFISKVALLPMKVTNVGFLT